MQNIRGDHLITTGKPIFSATRAASPALPARSAWTTGKPIGLEQRTGRRFAEGRNPGLRLEIGFSAGKPAGVTLRRLGMILTAPVLIVPHGSQHPPHRFRNRVHRDAVALQDQPRFPHALVTDHTGQHDLLRSLRRINHSLCHPCRADQRLGYQQRNHRVDLRIGQRGADCQFIVCRLCSPQHIDRVAHLGTGVEVRPQLTASGFAEVAQRKSIGRETVGGQRRWPAGVGNDHRVLARGDGLGIESQCHIEKFGKGLHFDHSGLLKSSLIGSMRTRQ